LLVILNAVKNPRILSLYVLACHSDSERSEEEESPHFAFVLAFAVVIAVVRKAP
jgi:hypothetical protein